MSVMMPVEEEVQMLDGHQDIKRKLDEKLEAWARRLGWRRGMASEVASRSRDFHQILASGDWSPKSKSYLHYIYLHYMCLKTATMGSSTTGS